ncbi:MAG TPA: M24 family metallopeptidase [Thermoanaerobaculia bacterium]|nr:M24 family metallopeptidase [Thermoanaerobaculia bacterium]
MMARLDALAAGLAELGCEALLVVAAAADDTDLAPFLPRAAHLGECFLVLPRGGEPRLGFLTLMEREEAAATGLALLTPDDLDISKLSSELTEAAPFLSRVWAKALELCGLRPGRIALAGHGPAGVIQGACALLAAQGWIWVPGNSLVFASRQRKEAPELAGIREAAAGTCEAMRAVAALLAAASHDGPGSVLRLAGEPVTVGRLRKEVERVFSARGLTQPRGNILAPAEEGAVPHNAGTPERALRAGESLVVDLYPRGDRLFADCTRTFFVGGCVGQPAEPFARAHAAVRAAVEEVHRLAVPGVRGWDLQELVCARFADLGYPTPISAPGTTRGYVHNLGHGVGFDLHEFPTFKKASGAEGVLRVGDVFTIEPGLYEPAPGEGQAGWGVRIEDLVHLGPDGLESLTPLPYDPDPQAWV